MRAAGAALPSADLAPAHRDFYYSQVLFGERRVTLIDLDLLTWADPAIDVANFIAHLCFLALQQFSDPHALDDAAARFVDEYARRSARIAALPGFWERVAFYQAATFFRLQHVVLQRPHWVVFFEPLFELTESSLRETKSLFDHQ